MKALLHVPLYELIQVRHVPGFAINTMKEFEAACQQGDRFNIDQSLPVPNRCWVRVGLRAACAGGHLDLVELMFAQGADEWDEGFYEACRNGHREVVDLLIKKGSPFFGLGEVDGDFEEVYQRKDRVGFKVKDTPTYMNWGLRGACRGGHLELARLTLELGANDWNGGLIQACEGDHLELIELMIQQGATKWDDGLIRACRSGRRESAERMIQQGATALDAGLSKACEANQLELAELMIEQGATGLDSALFMAYQYGDLPLIEMLRKKRGDD